jgi:hypothetical protein
LTLLRASLLCLGVVIYLSPLLIGAGRRVNRLGLLAIVNLLGMLFGGVGWLVAAAEYEGFGEVLILAGVWGAGTLVGVSWVIALAIACGTTDRATSSGTDRTPVRTAVER